MTEPTKIALNYEERQALPVIRKLLKRKPEAASLLMEGMSKAVAVSVLMQARDELKSMLEVTQAFKAAAEVLVKLDDQPKKETTDE